MSELTPDLSGIEAIFLDLDGTIYVGSELVPGALDFLSRCERRGIRRFFLSNNSSRSVDEYVVKLRGLGIPTNVADVLLSTHDLLAWLSKEGVSKTWLVGTEGMRSMLEDAGVGTRDEQPEYVVLGYDTEITYAKLQTASIHLHNGVPLVASHPDMVCPSPDGGLPDVGAYLALFEATTAVGPVHVCGKPNAGMILHKIEDLGLRPHQCAMVGDRLYTDMEMAERSGCHGILVVETGEACLSDLDSAPQSPSLVVGSVAELLPGG